jgi:uncharacterized radical SAM protein YgiQ
VTQLFLPANRKEMLARGWQAVDVILVTGDAYVDHPSFGAALIGRWLEANGYRVAVLAQPRWDSPASFQEFGAPLLFFGITAGNLDSIVANYSGNAKVRDRDEYSPAGNPYFGALAAKTARRRPDRAAIVYAQLARAAYREVPVILGGLEASLRRFVHYDYQQVKLRGSVLTDAKADLLVYGMGERAVLEVADRLRSGSNLREIAGTCERLTDSEVAVRGLTRPPVLLPSLQEILADRKNFLLAEEKIDRHARSCASTPLLQRQQSHWLLQHPAAAPLSTAELDRLYELPYTRAPHPQAGAVPAHRMINHSITIVRGCCGNCSFCAIARHQGAVITSRSQESVVTEAKRVAAAGDFRGTLTDLGGPTANLFGASCARDGCRRRDCLYPAPCRHLQINEQAMLDLLQQVAALPEIKHLHVSSGLRMELLLKTPRLLSRLLLHHTPGTLKIAPEHTEPDVLRLMHKPDFDLLVRFLQTCRDITRREGKNLRFTPYFISAHPGCTLRDMTNLVRKIGALDLTVRQFQDFTPTPGTLATAMYVSGLARGTHRPIPVARGSAERRQQRLVLEKAGCSSGNSRMKPEK